MTDARRLDASEEELWNTFYAMRRRLDRTLDAQLQRDFGISISEFEVLIAVMRAPGRRSRVRELVTVLGWEKSRISHQVTRMVARGFVERQECLGDRRASWIHLTREGRRVVVRALPEHIAAIRALLFDPLGSEQQAELLAISRCALTAMEELDTPD